MVWGCYDNLNSWDELLMCQHTEAFWTVWFQYQCHHCTKSWVLISNQKKKHLWDEIEQRLGAIDWFIFSIFKQCTHTHTYTYTFSSLYEKSMKRKNAIKSKLEIGHVLFLESDSSRQQFLKQAVSCLCGAAYRQPREEICCMSVATTHCIITLNTMDPFT